MTNEDTEGFGSRVIEEVGYYVYALVDPRTDKPFYIGKGKGGRVFSHEVEATASELGSEKLSKIRDIQSRGDEIKKIILRHGMTEKESLLAESVVIDFLRTYDIGLTNIAAGHHTSAFGMMTTDEVRRKYMAPALDSLGEDCVVININRSYRDAKMNADFYEVTRKWWSMADWRVNGLKYALAEFKGFVVEVFEIDDNGWEKDPASGRWSFTGQIASKNVRSLYINRRVPKKRGAANPITYNLTT
jgi:hypothetical protein